MVVVPLRHWRRSNRVKATSAKYILLAIAFVVVIVRYFLKTALIMVLGSTKGMSINDVRN